MIVLGTFPAKPKDVAPGELSLTEARDAYRSIRAGGELPAAAPVAAAVRAAVSPDAYTVRDLAGAWLAWFDGMVNDGRKSRATFKQYAGIVDREINPTIGDRPVADVTADDCAAVVIAIRQRGKATMSDRARAALSAMFNYGRKEIRRPELTGRANPADEVTKSGIDRDRGDGEIIDPRDVPAFLRELATPDAQGYRAALRLQAWTGCRIAEAVGATWKEVDLDRGTWTIQGATKNGDPSRTKNRRTHTVKLPRQAIAMLEGIKASQPAGRLFVFPNDAASVGHIRADIANKRIKEVHAAAGSVAPTATHAIRRSVRTWLAAMGCPREIAESILNHAKPGLVATYEKYGFVREGGEWLQRLADWQDEAAAEAKGWRDVIDP